MNRTTWIISVVVIILLLIGGIVYWNKRGGMMTPTGSASQNSIFSQQNAVIQGQVTKIDGRMLTIKNDQGVVAVFEAANPIFINKMNGTISPNQPVPTPMTNINDIDLNKNVVLNLTMENGKYKVFSASFIPTTMPQSSPLGSNTPSASASARP